MKSFRVVPLICLLVLANCSSSTKPTLSGWYPVHHSDLSLHSIDVLDENAAIATYGWGSWVVVRTTDGGKTWTESHVPRSVADIGSYLTVVHFVNADVGFLGVSNGGLVRTDDGGQSWCPVSTNTLVIPVVDVHFTNPDTGFVVGAGGLSWSQDGGQTWSHPEGGKPKTGERGVILKALSFPDTRTGFAVGEYGVVLKTEDAGVSWSQVSTGVETLSLEGVSFWSSEMGIAVGWGGTIIGTTDGGVTWTSRPSGTSENLVDVQFVSKTVGTVVGAVGTILNTRDGGETWVLKESGTEERLHAVDFLNEHIGMAVSWHNILKTTDGGH